MTWDYGIYWFSDKMAFRGIIWFNCFINVLVMRYFKSFLIYMIWNYMMRIFGMVFWVCDLVVLKHLHLPYAVVTDYGLSYARCYWGYSYCTGTPCTVHHGSWWSLPGCHAFSYCVADNFYFSTACCIYAGTLFSKTPWYIEAAYSSSGFGSCGSTLCPPSYGTYVGTPYFTTFTDRCSLSSIRDTTYIIASSS